ncbi:hypothetical protein LEN26_017173 [Aphanomyces euteiches]|nr:hypothetical protein LEN26_017173 [Aphanomyces euteiches]KAH9114155.1 hypothetical protein AeMF1_011731 [Aphanomyces euteiches]KAH9190516.1 hypothetical protein AeNC1_007506 [Aphanomyces euteiches]
MLAAQCFVSSACIVYWSTNRDIDATWHHLYVLAMGTKAVLDGILHYMVFKAMHHFNIQLAKVARRVFGLYLKQSTVDWCLRWVWRLVLGFTTLTNFALVAAPS